MDYIEFLLFIADKTMVTSLNINKSFNKEGRYSISLLNCEIKENKNDCLLRYVSGVGNTMQEAAQNYYEKLKDKYLVFNAYKDTRLELDFTEAILFYLSYKQN